MFCTFVEVTFIIFIAISVLITLAFKSISIKFSLDSSVDFYVPYNTFVKSRLSVFTVVGPTIVWLLGCNLGKSRLSRLEIPKFPSLTDVCRVDRSGFGLQIAPI